MRRLLLPILLLAGSSLSALEFFPPAPDSHTGVRIRFLALSCGAIAHAEVAGSTITLTSTSAPGISCVSPFVPEPAVADVGVLAPGVYDVHGEANERGTLVVRDAGAGFVVSPVGLSTAAKSNRTVQIFSDRIRSAPVSVTFDGIPATVQSWSGQSGVVTPPAHAAGTVDVTVVDAFSTRTAVAAFTYFDPSAPPEPAVLEPLLFPIAYSGPGVFGSQWRTENRIGTGNTLVRFRDLVKVEACNGPCGAFNWSAILSDPSPSGRLLWVVRRRVPEGLGLADDFRVSSRIIESSHPDDVNVNLPVVRERDFRNAVVIERVPISSHARVTLRVYSLDQSARFATVAIDRGGNVTRMSLPLSAVNGIGFGTLDLGPTDQQPRSEPVTITVAAPSKIWGLVTLTDNATQRVTAFWPQ